MGSKNPELADLKPNQRRATGLEPHWYRHYRLRRQRKCLSQLDLHLVKKDLPRRRGPDAIHSEIGKDRKQK